jgi:flagellar biosynthesis regulator FlaF
MFMNNLGTARRAERAYAAAAATRSLRAQEAEVFMRVTASLRHGVAGSPADRVRALADTSLLWSSVLDQVRDPANQLPDRLRAMIASVAIAVQREVTTEQPNFDFLIEVNENIASGLSDH